MEWQPPESEEHFRLSLEAARMGTWEWNAATGVATLRQHARPIVIEDQELARPFTRLLRARQLRLWALGEFVADTMSYAIGRSYGANIEADWYIARYVLPGNVQKVILKPKQFGYNAPTAANAGY